MHPSSLLSYYPTYAILDEIITTGGYKNLNIHIDLKNNLQSTYMEHAIVNIVESTKQSNHYDTSIFSSIISFLSFHKMWALKRGIETQFYIFYELGRSSYHQNISKKYKISRKIDDLYGLDRADRDLFFSVIQRNFELIERTLNWVPKTKVFAVKNLEADFIPYYLLSRALVPYGGDHGHVIYSNDHDLWQCAGAHSIIFSKAGKTKRLIKKEDVMEKLLKKKTNISDSYLPLAMSILGDPGDDVDGIPGVGPARLIDMFPELIEVSGDMRTIHNKVSQNLPVFDVEPDKVQNKYLKKVIQSEKDKQQISRNLRLVSFELISRELDDPKTTEMAERKKLITDVLHKNTVYPRETLKKALTQSNVFMETASIDFLYT